jgi:hypothetical protein
VNYGSILPAIRAIDKEIYPEAAHHAAATQHYEVASPHMRISGKKIQNCGRML